MRLSGLAADSAGIRHPLTALLGFEKRGEAQVFICPACDRVRPGLVAAPLTCSASSRPGPASARPARAPDLRPRGRQERHPDRACDQERPEGDEALERDPPEGQQHDDHDTAPTTPNRVDDREMSRIRTDQKARPPTRNFTSPPPNAPGAEREWRTVAGQSAPRSATMPATPSGPVDTSGSPPHERRNAEHDQRDRGQGDLVGHAAAGRGRWRAGGCARRRTRRRPRSRWPARSAPGPRRGPRRRSSP